MYHQRLLWTSQDGSRALGLASESLRIIRATSSRNEIAQVMRSTCHRWENVRRIVFKQPRPGRQKMASSEGSQQDEAERVRDESVSAATSCG